MHGDGKNDMHVMIALHSNSTFYREDMRKDIYLQCEPMKYYIDYEVRIEKEFKGGNQACKRYDFDLECVYHKFEVEIPKNTSNKCTVPWAFNSSNICNNPEDIEIAKEMVENITKLDIQSCNNPCLSMPTTFTGGHNARNTLSNHKSSISVISLELLFQPWISTSVEFDLYTFWSLGAEVGGYVGIMVGYSLLALADHIFSFLRK